MFQDLIRPSEGIAFCHILWAPYCMVEDNGTGRIGQLGIYIYTNYEGLYRTDLEAQPSTELSFVETGSSVAQST